MWVLSAWAQARLSWHRRGWAPVWRRGSEALGLPGREPLLGAASALAYSVYPQRLDLRKKRSDSSPSLLGPTEVGAGAAASCALPTSQEPPPMS